MIGVATRTSLNEHPPSNGSFDRTTCRSCISEAETESPSHVPIKAVKKGVLFVPDTHGTRSGPSSTAAVSPPWIDGSKARARKTASTSSTAPWRRDHTRVGSIMQSPRSGPAADLARPHETLHSLGRASSHLLPRQQRGPVTKASIISDARSNTGHGTTSSPNRTSRSPEGSPVPPATAGSRASIGRSLAWIAVVRTPRTSSEASSSPGKPARLLNRDVSDSASKRHGGCKATSLAWP